MAEHDRAGWFQLPGFLPDAVPFAVRTTLALLLAYGVGFLAQVPSAASAGITVGIIAQPSAGMALSKAFYRVAGTVLGCIVALLLGAAFAQDRTMLLMGFAAWMGLCTAAATLLRDFRSYGAALSGYTVAIIAVGGIDDPDGLLLSSLNRTAAVLIGIAAVALVNVLLGGTPALRALQAGLRRQRDTIAGLAQDALEGRPLPDPLALTQLAAATTALQTDAGYAAAEQPHGRRRRRGAEAAIGSLLGALSAARTVAETLAGPHARLLSPDIRQWLPRFAAACREDAPEPPPPRLAEPIDALLVERARTLQTRLRDVDSGIRVLDGGIAPLPDVALRATVDRPAAIINAARVIIACGLAAAFIVLSGWPGATLVLIQQSAFVGLLGTMNTPARNSVAFLLPLLPCALATGLVAFLVLPLAATFEPFCLAVAGLMMLTALLSRHRALAAYGPAALIYVTLLLQPANPQLFDLAGFLNTTLEVGLAVVFTILSFLLILPVSPKRRLYRIFSAIADDLRRTQRRPHGAAAPQVAQARLYDRLVRALSWLGPPTPARRRLLQHLYRVGAADIALRRAHAGLDALQALADTALRHAAAEARQALDAPDDAALLASSRHLLHAGETSGDAATPGLCQAVSGIVDLLLQDGTGRRTSRFVRLMTA